MIQIICQQQKKEKTSGGVNPPIPTTNNQLGEIDYFNAHYLPLSEKSNIQTALNTYGSIRLGRGDYRGVAITITSNQKIFGHVGGSTVSNITIAQGSNGVQLENLVFSDNKLIFQSGTAITNSKIKTIRFVYVEAVNARLENNELINIAGQIKFDCSTSGYFRNNKIIKHQAQSISNQLIMKGNATTPSYGNVNLHSNYLTPVGDTTDISGIQSGTFVGVDSEGWNLEGAGTKAMFYVRNSGDLKITNFGGGNAYSAVNTGAFDIDTTNLFFLDKYLKNTADTLSRKTNMFLINGEGTWSRGSGSDTPGYNLIGNNDASNAIVYNGVEQSSTITDPTTLTTIRNAIKGTQYTPWSKPTWEVLPNPSGDNWQTERIGKPDSTAYIQNLIDTNGIAELPEGTFYIGSTLNVPLDNLHGITGRGTGKTIIIGLTDTFPLITLGYGSTKSFTLSYLTLQGGSVGVYSGITAVQIAYTDLKYVIFRNQQYGIQLRRIMGFDNNFFEYVDFVNCQTGFFQDPLRPYVNDLDTSSYVDKTMFYNSQFKNCTTPFSMLATRPNNLNAWVGCSFDTGQSAILMGGQNYPIIANCEFKGFTGNTVISSNTISVYSSKFSQNTPIQSVFNCVYAHIEGSEFLDTQKMFQPIEFNSTFQYILNSTITGDVAVPKPNNNYYESSAIYSNSLLSSNSARNKLFVNVKLGNVSIVINETPTPYPQLLVTQ